RAKVEHTADAAQRVRLGQIEDEATRAEVADLERREAELVAGHQDLRFTGLVTVSAPDEATLAERCTAMETAAAQAMCEVRRLVGQQGVAFLAAALPLARGVL
ncbi:MAG TPA: SCO6880 family protein, partial [Rugosimonospora sp.]|nr:SCO6880 family protein [Rugosimonospora sp.]